MATFVLVHGAWHGSWCWKRVRKALHAQQGHDVFTPSLTGVGERSHLISPQVNLDTHIDDIVNLIRWEELSDVVLCGHSYGGAVISGVADRVPDRVGAMVYLDAFVLEDGQSLHDTLPPAQKNLQLELTQQHGEGWKVPPIPAEDGWNDSPFPAFYERAKARGWKTLTMPCGHDVMLDRPEELTSALLGVAAAQPAAR